MAGVVSLRVCLRALVRLPAAQRVGAAAAVRSPGRNAAVSRLCASPSPFWHSQQQRPYATSPKEPLQGPSDPLFSPAKTVEERLCNSADDEVEALGACTVALPVHDPYKAWYFYHDVLGFPCTAKTEHSLTFNVAGHTLRCHTVGTSYRQRDYFGADSGHLPIPYVGFQVSMRDFHLIVHRLIESVIDFVRHPAIVDEDQSAGRWLVQVRDPSGNVIEFSSPLFPQDLFVKYRVQDEGPSDRRV